MSRLLGRLLAGSALAVALTGCSLAVATPTPFAGLGPPGAPPRATAVVGRGSSGMSPPAEIATFEAERSAVGQPTDVAGSESGLPPPAPFGGPSGLPGAPPRATVLVGSARPDAGMGSGAGEASSGQAAPAGRAAGATANAPTGGPAAGASDRSTSTAGGGAPAGSVGGASAFGVGGPASRPTAAAVDLGAAAGGPAVGVVDVGATGSGGSAVGASGPGGVDANPRATPTALAGATVGPGSSGASATAAASAATRAGSGASSAQTSGGGGSAGGQTSGGGAASAVAGGSTGTGGVTAGPGTTASTPVVIGAPAQSGGPAAVPPVSVPDPSIPTPSPTTPPPTAVTTGSRGITFGKPVAFASNGPVTTLGLPVTNDSSTTKSFAMKVTYRSGDATAVAFGAIEELRPGETRVAPLIMLDTMPATYGGVNVEVDGAVRESTPGSELATRLTVGSPSTRTENGVARLYVDVRNGDAVPRTLTLTAAFWKAGDLVGIARGGVPDLPVGQSRAVPMLVYGLPSGSLTADRGAANSLPAYDRVEVAVD